MTLVLSLPAAASELTAPEAGVVVVDVAKGSAAEAAGLRADDALDSWQRGGPAEAEGGVQTPFDVLDVELEQAPLGAITLRGRREGHSRSWTLAAGAWGLRCRPSMLPEQLQLYRDGREQAASGALAAALERWASAAAQPGLSPRDAAWWRWQIAQAWSGARRWPEADAAYADGVKALEDDAAAPHLLRPWAETFRGRSAWKEADERYQRALVIDRRRSGEGLASAADLTGLAQGALERWDVHAAEDHARQALAIRERLAPDSLETASSLSHVGNALLRRDELSAAEEFYHRALPIRLKRAPDSMVVASSYNNLGVAAWRRGDLATAEGYFQEDLKITERLDPGGLNESYALVTLGMVAHGRGDFAAAEDDFLRGLALQEKLAPDSLPLAGTLNNLAALASDREDNDRAIDYYRRCIAIKETLAPDTLSLAMSLEGLAEILSRGIDPAQAEQLWRRGLTIEERVAPDSVGLGETLTGLGDLLLQRGDPAGAESALERAQVLIEKQGPGMAAHAGVLESLGQLALAQRAWPLAESRYAEALRIREQLTPGTFRVALALHGLARAYRGMGQPEKAAQQLGRSLDALEAQAARLGGSHEARARFGASYTEFYHDAIDVLLELGRREDAFAVVERSRARAFLLLLAERDLAFAADLPGDLVRERKRADAAYDHTQAELAELSPAKDAEAIERLQQRLREQRDVQEQIAQRIRAAAPRLASLQHPEPLDLERARASLDPGSVLLAYSVGPAATRLFVVRPPADGPDSLSVVSLPIGERELRERVESFRQSVQRTDTSGRAGLEAKGRELYETLVQPAEASIEASARVLVSPDGPLHRLPFAALVDRRGRYLVEAKPLHTVASATVYAELRKWRQAAPASAQLVAFGDPLYPSLGLEGAGGTDPELRSASLRGLRLAPLPSARREVEELGALYGRDAVLNLGAQATEERAKALDRRARYVHFACHGRIDERFPLNSALVLTIPDGQKEGRENGLLQAWEIFEQVRLDADLVTLSSCESALGTEMGGEGLLGLARAFQFAGARSVLASLWAVSDRSTADLMKSLYGQLKAGKSKDEALRSAQLAAIRAARTSHPFYWAAFQLIGDWK